MRLRQLVLACGLTSLVLSPYASALGLGEVKLKSTLNQPLEAEVKLLDTRDLTAEQILVALASPADFERNGVDRLFFYTEFQFQVDLQAADGPKVVITSRSPVREPYLNFLIEARWTAGRLLREYTLLMDLPTFDEGGSTQAVQTAVTTSPAQRPKTTAATPRPATASTGSSNGARQASTARQPSLSGDQYEVRSNDTLWEIALRARPDSSVSVHQSMMALYRANPEAFINGNINRLRRGQVLRVPDASEMKSLGKSEAVSQFAQASGDSDFGAQLNASRRTSQTSNESAAASGRVKLAAPTSGSTGAGQGSGANDGAGRSLESELAATLEELDKSKAENTELGSRIKDLEAQIQTMESLVEVSNEKLRAMQVTAGQTQPAAEAPVPLTPTPEPAAELTGVTSSEAAVTASSEATVAASSEAAASSVAAAATPAQPTPPKKVVAPIRPQPTLADHAIEHAPWIGLGVLGLAGAGYFAYRRRKQAEEQAAEEQEDVFAVDDSLVQQEESATEADSFNDINEASLFDEDSETSAVAETGDVVGEADIYIAYGKLDQAEEMLLNALQKDPDSTDIRMKLLEVYSQQQNGPAFDKHYAALLPLAGGALLARASELREGISGAGEFDPVASSSNDFADTNADQFSLDDFDLNDETPAQVETNEPTNFDFNLDLDDDETNLAAMSEDSSSSTANEFELDFGDDLASGASETDDLSELSLALDNMESDILPEDVEVNASSVEENFDFNLDDDLDLGDLEQELEQDELPSHELVMDAPGSLDVAADDFNLDMNVDDVDLAALDHEMESLDVDFDEDLLAENNSPVDVAANEFALDTENDVVTDDLDFSDLESAQEDVTASNLNLTDDLDESAAPLNFALDDELTDFNVEDSNSLSSGSFDFAGAETPVDNGFAALENELNELSEPAEIADTDFTIDDDLTDLEFQNEFASQPEASVSLADEQVQENAQEEHDEDLFAQALSDFSGESDDIDLNEYSSDEAALADLSDDDMDAELDFLADADEAATKLDLARAYIDMGDSEGAKDILSEVLGEGNDEQRKEASELLGRIG